MKKRPDRILSMKYRLFNDGILIMINYNPRATGQYNHQYIKQTRFFKRVGYCMSQSSTINSTPTHFGVVPVVFFGHSRSSLPLLLSMRWMSRGPILLNNLGHPGTFEALQHLSWLWHSQSQFSSINFWQLLSTFLTHGLAPPPRSVDDKFNRALTNSSKDRFPKAEEAKHLNKHSIAYSHEGGTQCRKTCPSKKPGRPDRWSCSRWSRHYTWLPICRAWISSSFNIQNFGRKWIYENLWVPTQLLPPPRK